MRFTCPHCKKGSFTITNDASGAPLAKCNYCGTVRPFSRQEMKETRPTLRLFPSKPDRRATG